MAGLTVPAIALYASPPSSVCSSAHQMSAHTAYDIDLNSRTSSSTPCTTAPSHKQIIGGLSCLFSSSSTDVAASYNRGEELKELSSSFGYSYGSLKREPSPVSVFQGPVSCSGSRSSPISVSLKGSTGLFNRFVRNALGSCVDYDNYNSPSFEVDDIGALNAGSSSVLVDELTFNMEDSLVEGNVVSYAKDFLADAQARHKIFYDDVVVKAFYGAEKAHRGQVNEESMAFGFDFERIWFFS